MREVYIDADQWAVKSGWSGKCRPRSGPDSQDNPAAVNPQDPGDLGRVDKHGQGRATRFSRDRSNALAPEYQEDVVGLGSLVEDGADGQADDRHDSCH